MVLIALEHVADVAHFRQNVWAADEGERCRQGAQGQGSVVPSNNWEPPPPVSGCVPQEVPARALIPRHGDVRAIKGRMAQLEMVFDRGVLQIPDGRCVKKIWPLTLSA